MPVHYSEQSSGPSTRRARMGVEYFSPDVASYEGWTKAQLKEEAEARGLSGAGTKAELTKRLQASD